MPDDQIDGHQGFHLRFLLSSDHQRAPSHGGPLPVPADRDQQPGRHRLLRAWRRSCLKSSRPRSVQPPGEYGRSPATSHISPGQAAYGGGLQNRRPPNRNMLIAAGQAPERPFLRAIRDHVAQVLPAPNEYRVSPTRRAVTVATKRQRPVWQTSLRRVSPGCSCVAYSRRTAPATTHEVIDAARRSYPRSFAASDTFVTLGANATSASTFGLTSPGPPDRDCDRDMSEPAERGETGGGCMASSGHGR
jgi:hypothetical protein